MSPRVSVVTGLHAAGNAYVGETYASLREQTLQDWEWVVVQNNGGALPAEIRSDPRVRALDVDSKSVGEIKRRACAAARAPHVVELDADDLLVLTALELVDTALGAGADFCFSDFAEFRDGTWEPRVYGSEYGWRNYPVTYKWRPLLATVAPEATPQNLRRVLYAPNHVRAWRAEAYWRVGGHDPALAVMDDHDLVVRLFLAGARIEKIPEVLYLYRLHAGNTVGTRNAEIQAAAQASYERYCWRLAEASGRVWVGRDTSCRGEMKPGEWLFVLCPKSDWYDRAKIPLLKGDFHVSWLYEREHSIEGHLIRTGPGYDAMGLVAGD